MVEKRSSPDGSTPIEVELALAVEAEHRLQVALIAALDDGAIIAAAPTRLPGWTVGHVLTHLSRNADSHIEMLAGGIQYGGSSETRDGEIDAGAGRPVAAIVADVVSSSQALVRQWARADWSGTATRLGGAVVSVGALPLLRMREVEVHRVDLDLEPPHDYRFTDFPSDYVRRDLRQLTMVYQSRLPMGLKGLPPEALQLTPALRLAWLLDRDPQAAGELPPSP